jgi:hypothetical protein
MKHKETVDKTAYLIAALIAGVFLVIGYLFFGVPKPQQETPSSSESTSAGGVREINVGVIPESSPSSDSSNAPVPSE